MGVVMRQPRTYKTDYFPRLLKPDFRASDLVD